MIYDLNKVGMSNIDMNKLKKLISVTQEIYCDRLYRTYIIRPPFVVGVGLKTVMSFVDKRIQYKIRNLGNNFKDTFRKDFDEDMLP